MNKAANYNLLCDMWIKKLVSVIWFNLYFKKETQEEKREVKKETPETKEEPKPTQEKG